MIANAVTTADSAALRHTLVASMTQMGLDATERQVDQLLGFVALLAKWNRTYNLTAIRDTGGMLSRHVLDCLSVIGPLRRERAQRGIGRVLDVGSGGGLPGVVIAVMNPSAAVTCVDAVGKKAAFVQQVAADLGLGNLRSAHARVETLQADPFDVIASRAFASLHDFVILTQHLLAADGQWMAMKGRRPDDELARVQPVIGAFHVEQLKVDPLTGERCILWMVPSASRVSTDIFDRQAVL